MIQEPPSPLPGLIAEKVLLCVHTAPPPSPAHTLVGSHSKSLLIKAFCSRLSVYMHPSVHLCQPFGGFLMLNCKPGSNSILCPVHYFCINMPSGKAGSLHCTKQLRMSTFPLSSTLSYAPMLLHLLFPPCLEAHPLPYTLVSTCPKSGLGTDPARCFADIPGLS